MLNLSSPPFPMGAQYPPAEAGSTQALYREVIPGCSWNNGISSFKTENVSCSMGDEQHFPELLSEPVKIKKC